MNIDIHDKSYKLSNMEVRYARKMCMEFLDTVKERFRMESYPTFFPTFCIMMHAITGNVIENMNLEGLENALKNLEQYEQDNKAT